MQYNNVALTGLVLYHPLIEIWSGTVRLHRDDDLKEAREHLPPSAIVSDGRKRLVRKEALRTLLAVRKRVDRLLHGKGFSFMGGIAVPESRCSEIEAELPKLEQDFNQALDVLCGNLESEYQALRNEYPEWSTMLARSALDEKVVRSRCNFRVVPLRVAPPDSSISDAAANRFNSIAGAALPTLLRDIAGDAEWIHTNSFKGKGRVSAKTAQVVRRLVDKLSAFSFLDPRVGPMSAALHNLMRSMPSTGYLSIPETASVVMVLNSLSDPEGLITYGVASIPTDIADELLAGTPDMFFPDAQQVTDAPVPPQASVPPVPVTHQDAFALPF